MIVGGTTATGSSKKVRTLKGLARVWFSRLIPNSISTFKELSM